MLLSALAQLLCDPCAVKPLYLGQPALPGSHYLTCLIAHFMPFFLSSSSRGFCCLFGFGCWFAFCSKGLSTFGAETGPELVTVLPCQPLCFQFITATLSATSGFRSILSLSLSLKHPERGMADPLPVFHFHFLSSLSVSHSFSLFTYELPRSVTMDINQSMSSLSLGILLTDYSIKLLSPLIIDHACLCFFLPVPSES